MHKYNSELCCRSHLRAHGDRLSVLVDDRRCRYVNRNAAVDDWQHRQTYLGHRIVNQL